MGNSQHVKWLREGVNAWNKRRIENPFNPDLQNEDISGLFDVEHSPLLVKPPVPVLKGIDLSDADLSGSVLENLDLSGSNFRNAILNNARLSGSSLIDSTFHHTHLNDAKLRLCNLAGTRFESTWLISADLWGSDLEGSDFFLCHLKDANLAYANLLGTTFPLSQPWTATLFPSHNKKLTSSESDKHGCVDSVDSWMEEVRTLTDCNSDDVVLYFRGESRYVSHWELRPAVMRKPKGNQKVLRPVEGEMLNDLMTRQPEAFSECDSALAEWVLAQHYKLPTRFLDITRNPLVALFNASDQNRCQDGRLHIFAVHRSQIKFFDSDAISVISNFAKLSRWEKNLLLGKIEANDKSDQFHRLSSVHGRELMSRVKTRLYDFIRREKPYFQEKIDIRDLFSILVVEPQRMFERIRAQSGAFLVSGYYERFEHQEVLNCSQEIPIYSHFVRRVPHKTKKSTLDDLSLLNVTRETLFPSVDESSDSVTEKFLNRSDAIDDD